MKKERFVIFATLCLIVLVIFLFQDWASMRFWLYHSQNRNLKPVDYNVTVLTHDEYERLINPDVRQVHIGNGTQTFIKADDPDWEVKAKSRYKSVYDGKYYVEVITRGTAHALIHWYGTFVPAVIFSLGALLFLTVYHVKEKTAKCNAEFYRYE